MALTAKQERFIAEYLIDCNASAAILRAGYKSKNPDVDGYKLLVTPSIQKEVQRAMDERAKRLNIKADDVLAEIASIANDDISNYLDFRTEKVFVGYDAEGKPVSDYKTIADLKDSKTINTKNISEISIGKDGQFKFKLYCRDEALVNLGKHLKLFTEKIEHSGETGVRIINDIPRSKRESN
jgi:phage terminase small subunit